MTFRPPAAWVRGLERRDSFAVGSLGARREPERDDRPAAVAILDPESSAMGLEDLTTRKFVIQGEGQLRE